MTSKNVINRIKEFTGLNQESIALELFDISPSNLSNKIKRDSVDFLRITTWAEHQNVNLNWLFTGKGPHRIGPEDAEFLKSVDGCLFADKALALKITKELLFIELMDPLDFRWIAEKIIGKAEYLRLKNHLL